MAPLALIAAIPIVLAIASAILPLRAVRVLVPIGVWLQLPVIAFITWPVLTKVQPFVRMSPEFAVDHLGAMFMLLTTLVAASSLSHAAYYFHAERHILHDSHLRLFYGPACLFLLTMTAVFACDNLGALWIAVELTTLTSSSLVYFDRTKSAVEATWKYLIICSVGIAFALLGTVLLFASSQHSVSQVATMEISQLILRAPTLNAQLLHLGVIACILGYGTKAGVFPLHNWLPDAHSEAPAPASAILSGALLNCALFAIWRVTQILVASHQLGPIINILVTMGAITAVAASLMLLKQHSFKRMWAYSSVENVGIMLVTIAMGSGVLFFLQALNHSIAKVALFLVTGNIVQSTGTKRLNNLHGIITTAPAWGVLLALGSFAITGAPPFGLFVSEVGILTSTANLIYWPVSVALLVAVSISFIAVSAHVGRIICGAPMPGFIRPNQFTSSLMPGLLMLASLILGCLVSPQVWLK